MFIVKAQQDVLVVPINKEIVIEIPLEECTTIKYSSYTMLGMLERLQNKQVRKNLLIIT